ncbi:PEP/pyruvate-binding domain-containing protein [Oscillibacter sp.]|uniref:PEP/pyruvate-binding domain-containing protein n=1 Tax=Oscillibacter sp. TaxID=1945593 RepID=UPI0028A00502|nr:PEP/pyruvate-binding domain-containing protein [Oscillibacter sp.]
MKYIRNFQEIRKEDISAVGGKGANLGEMFNAGLPVPDGFCITGEAFDEYMKRNGFDQQASACCETLRSEIASGQFWAELEQEIAGCYAVLGENVRVAVRSSATAEDLPEASFAGQQETYLNVVGIEPLMIAIKKCFASLYSARAVAYRKQANFDAVKVSLAVVIQKMVESEVSGVLFTADPVSQNPDQMMLNASWGLGEAIVSGKVTPDIYIYSKKAKRIADKKLGDKDILICYGTTGIEERKTPLEQKNHFCLNDKQVLEVFAMGQKVEQHYGSPQDIEWAISGGKLYLLQSRPITTLSEKANERQPELSASQRALLNNWIEHCPTPLYPLDIEPCEIIDRAKSKVFQELGISIGGELSMDENGILSFSAGTMRISPRIAKVPFLLGQFTNYAVNSSNTNGAFSKIKKELEEISATDVSRLSVPALLQQVRALMNLSEEIAYVRFRYNIFPSVAVSKLLYPTLQRVDKKIDEFDLLSDLPYKTWELNVALRKLAAYIQDHKELNSAVTNYKIMDRSAIETIRGDYLEFSVRLQNFLNEFGWKSSSSYCAFGSVSWFEDIIPLFSLIKALLQSDNKDLGNHKYQAILEKIALRFSAKKAAKVRKKIEEIRGYHINREESLYLIEMCYGLARRSVFELELRFPEIFEQPKDILFLTLEEIYALPAGTQNYRERVAVRKANRPQNEKLWSGLSIGGEVNNENALTGVSGNRGICQGKVKKILTLQEFDKMQQGDILVCRYTDPSWTPLFILASAVISDTGGPLSHSAIVAREYNIPAVLGCGNATELLNDGQEVVVDGEKGVVRIVT